MNKENIVWWSAQYLHIYRNVWLFAIFYDFKCHIKKYENSHKTSIMLAANGTVISALHYAFASEKV